MMASEKRFRPGSIGELLSCSGLSASELGRRIGVSRQAIWAYREGVTTPQFATVLKLAEVGGKPLDFFIEREGQGE